MEYKKKKEKQMNKEKDKKRLEMVIAVGNIGSGKSLLSRKYAAMGHNSINLDLLVSMMGGGEYSFYDKEKIPVYSSAETAIIKASLRNGNSVYIDKTNINTYKRERYIKIGKEFGCWVVGIDFGRGRKSNLENRIRDNRGVTARKWKEVFDFMDKSYVKPRIDEGFDVIYPGPKTFETHAFDFDGTIVERKYPEIGKIKENVVKKIKDLYYFKNNIIVIWTCRSGEALREMREFLIENKIPFDAINENPVFKTGGPKIFANKYYDDRNEIL